MLRLKRASFKSGWVWIVISGIALILAVLLHRMAQGSAMEALPENVRSCVPTGVKFERLAQVQQGEISYYLLGLNGGDQGRTEESDFLILMQNNQCRPLTVKPLAPLSSIVPLETAKQLELQRYRLWIRSYGKDNFQQVLDSTPTIHPLAPEIQWALQQLGVRIPQAKR